MPAANEQQRIRISGGRVIDPASGVDSIQDMYVAAGRIVSMGQAPDGFTSDREIDASGQVVCPGLIDLCARLREPGQEHKATIASESLAAASGGVTTLCCPPDTHPVIDTPAVTEFIRLRAEAAGKARIVTLGALTQGLGGECLKCHVAHGTSATMSQNAAAGDITWPGANPAVWQGSEDDYSRLLHIDNRGVCMQCHDTSELTGN